MSGELFTKLLKADASTCPDCGMALDLYCRPVNVRFLLCCNCEREYSEEFIAGYEAGRAYRQVQL
jgi:hypothetical protein